MQHLNLMDEFMKTILSLIVPEVPQMGYQHLRDNKGAQTVIAQFDSAFFALELPLDHG